jgi:hypothetical protein
MRMGSSSDAGPPARTRSASKVSGVVLVSGLVLVVFACGEIRPDEIECEEAVMHLTHCCPEVDARGFNCQYQTTCGDTLRPSISIKTSQCIRNESCETLAGSGTCGRALSGNFLADGERGPGSAFDLGLCR